MQNFHVPIPIGLAIVLLTAALCSIPPASEETKIEPTPPPQVEPIGSPAAAAAAVDARPIIYAFEMSRGCPGCVQMRPTIAELKSEGHRVIEIDGLDPANAKYVDYYGVTRYPQFVTIDSAGQPIRRTTPGVTTKAAILGLSSAATQPATRQTPAVYAAPARSGWFRARTRRVFSGGSCGPGGC